MNTLMNLLSLSVGIACFIFISIYINKELSYDKFHREADSIQRVVIDFVDDQGVRIPDATTPPALSLALEKDFPEVEASTRLFPAWGSKFLIGTSDQQRFYEKGLIRVDSTFFDVFDFPVLHGNLDEALNAPDKIVITKSMALKYFSKVDVVGETLTVYSFDNKPHLVSAVLEDIPDNSHFDFDFLTPLTFYWINKNWGWFNFYTYIRLSPESNSNEFENKLQPYYETKVTNPNDKNNIIYTQPITTIHLRSNLKFELGANGNMSNVYIFSALGVFLLIVSCLNYLNLSIAHSFKRLKEVGVRKVYGANKRLLIRQFLVESFLILIVSLILAVLFSELLFLNFDELLGSKISLLDADNLSILLTLSLGVLAFGLFLGLYQALFLSSHKVSNAVRGIFGSTGKKKYRLQRGLLIIQFTISSFMILGVLVVQRQLNFIQDQNLGLDVNQVLVIENISSVNNLDLFKSQLLNIPAVESVTSSNGMIGDFYSTTSLGYPNSFVMNFVNTDPEFIETLGLELISGRNFNSALEVDKQGLQMIVNEQGLESLGLELGDVGRLLPLDKQKGDSIVYGTVLGVVKDFHFRSFKNEIKPMALFYNDDGVNFLSVKLATDGLSESLEKIESKWKEFSNGTSMDYAFLDQTFQTLHIEEQKLKQVLLYVTVLAIFVAMMGMLAISNITIQNRKKEISIRKVLGASLSHISFSLTKRFVLLVIVANIIGIPIAYRVMTRWLEGFAYRTSIDLSTVLIVFGIGLLSVILTAGLRASNAGRKNPIHGLRTGG